MEAKTFTFFTDQVSYKTIEDVEGKKRYMVEGYASTTDLDLVGDICTSDCQEDMLAQIKGRSITTKLDMEHEEWTEGGGDVVPTGKIFDAYVDEKGLYIKAEINPHIKQFKSIWRSIKGGFVDAFSIAFRVLKKSTQEIDGVAVRMLEKVQLLNVALTGNPANPEARITKVMAKSLDFEETEEKNMAEEQLKSEDAVVEEAAPAAEAQPEPEATEPVAEAEASEEAAEVAEEAPAADGGEEVKNLTTVVNDLQAQLAELKSAKTDELAELKSRLEAAEKALNKPLVKNVVEEPKVALKTEEEKPATSVLGLI